VRARLAALSTAYNGAQLCRADRWLDPVHSPAGSRIPLLFLGVVLFGIGNATSLPPLIAQVEFPENYVPRVVALTVAVAQAVYALAPATFGLVREFAPRSTGPSLVRSSGPLRRRRVCTKIGDFRIFAG
jgi:hypothetical protein